MIAISVALNLVSFILGLITMFVVMKVPSKSDLKLITTATYQEDRNGKEIKRPVLDMSKFIDKRSNE